jgi:hypothetical protein
VPGGQVGGAWGVCLAGSRRRIRQDSGRGRGERAAAAAAPGLAARTVRQREAPTFFATPAEEKRDTKAR